MILRITAESSTIRILSLRNGALLVEWWCWCESRKQRQRLPGSVKLNRPLQGQRRDAKSKAGAASSAPTKSKSGSKATAEAGGLKTAATNSKAASRATEPAGRRRYRRRRLRRTGKIAYATCIGWGWWDVRGWRGGILIRGGRRSILCGALEGV